MRTKLVLAAAALGAVGVILPAQPASAVCMRAWELVTGDCSPCTTVGGPYREIADRLGDPLGSLASCAA